MKRISRMIEWENHLVAVINKFNTHRHESFEKKFFFYFRSMSFLLCVCVFVCVDAQRYLSHMWQLFQILYILVILLPFLSSDCHTKRTFMAQKCELMFVYMAGCVYGWMRKRNIFLSLSHIDLSNVTPKHMGKSHHCHTKKEDRARACCLCVCVWGKIHEKCFECLLT